MSIIRIKLDRTDSSTPWGFRMAGGKDFGAPLTIQKVNPGSLAYQCGLQVGDTITHIADQNVTATNHKQAQDLIMQLGNCLDLKVERGSSDSFSTSSYNNSSVEQPSASFKSSYAPTTSFSPGFLGPKPFVANRESPKVPSFNSNQSDSLPWEKKSGPSSGYVGSSQDIWKPQVPSGDRKMRVGKAGQARSCGPALETARIPVCSACRLSIRGPFISALDKTWCPEHFVCANPSCRAALINCGFVEEAEQLYCEMDYEKYLAPHCGKCARPIIGEVVNALKNTFHMNCFVCISCHRPIGAGSFHNEDGKIYCNQDWAKLFQTKCYGCQFPIEGGDRWVEALSQNWHSECFNCSACQISLEGQTFVSKNGKPYCKKHGATPRF